MYEVKDVDNISPIVLAYIGDAVYDLYVRTKLIAESRTNVDRLHKAATGYVKAAAQAQSFRAVESVLTEQELSIFKRGRNAKSAVPKNADMGEYRVATGLETLVGYIYLKQDITRLNDIMNLILGDDTNEGV